MTQAIRHRLAATAVAAVLAVALASPGIAQEKFKALSVKTPDGLTISAQEWGNPLSMDFPRAACRGPSRSTATSPRNSTW
jgi:hypothetical protein